MRGWGSKTPKRTNLWSNSYAIRKFQTASKFSRAVKAGRELADVYYDKAGRKRYKGNKRLKQSQSDTQIMLHTSTVVSTDLHDLQCIMGCGFSNKEWTTKGISGWLWYPLCHCNEVLPEGAITHDKFGLQRHSVKAMAVHVYFFVLGIAWVFMLNHGWQFPIILPGPYLFYLRSLTLTISSPLMCSEMDSTRRRCLAWCSHATGH